MIKNTHCEIQTSAKWIILAFISIIVIAFCIISMHKLSVRDYDGQHYIAHAGGMIDGFTYTNSLEAIDNAIANDIDYIELDLCLTSDGHLVASHNWIGLDSIANHGAPSYEDFKNAKVYDKFTTLTYERIDSILDVNPQLKLVTDKKSTPGIINQYFGKYKDRVYVECFRLSHYYRLKWKGFNVLMSSYPETNKNMQKHFWNPKTWIELPIQNYCFGGVTSDFDSEELYGTNYAISTFQNRRSADSIFALHPKVKWIYIDDISK